MNRVRLVIGLIGAVIVIGAWSGVVAPYVDMSYRFLAAISCATGVALITWATTVGDQQEDALLE